MSVDSQTVRKIARLARIAVTDDEVPGLVEQLNGILGWVEQLGEVDTTGIEPMASVMPWAWPTRAAAREASRMPKASERCASGMVIGAKKRTTLP